MLLLVLALVNVFVLRTNSRVNRLYLRGVIYLPAVRTHTLDIYYTKILLIKLTHGQLLRITKYFIYIWYIMNTRPD